MTSSCQEGETSGTGAGSCRVWFKQTNSRNGGQCVESAQYTVSGWSNAASPAWSPIFTDNTDDRDVRCTCTTFCVHSRADGPL